MRSRLPSLAALKAMTPDEADDVLGALADRADQDLHSERILFDGTNVAAFRRNADRRLERVERRRMELDAYYAGRAAE